MSESRGWDHGEYMRLTEEFRATFDWKKAGFTRDGFIHWARNKADFPIRIDPHKWRPFRDGEPVPRAMVEAFSEYISDILCLGRFALKSIAIPCDPPSAATQKEQRDIWRLGWIGALAFFARNFSVPEAAYCRDEEDLREAATMILRRVGESHNRSLTGAAAIAYAEQVMGRSRDEHMTLLLRLWKANEHSVLFATLPERGKVIRAGACVCAAITPGFYQRYQTGQAEDIDITPDDLQVGSGYIQLGAASDNHAIDVRRAKAARSVAMTRTICFQIAALAPPLHLAEANLRLIAMAGTPENRGRLKSYRFRETGTLSRITGFPIAEFTPPSAAELGTGYPLALAEYLAMKAIVLMFQASIQAHQEQLAQE